jgi:hypothetical protein
MAPLQERNGSYRGLFCHRGKLHTFTIGKIENDEAESKARQVDYWSEHLRGARGPSGARVDSPRPPLRPAAIAVNLSALLHGRMAASLTSRSLSRNRLAST